ncbi:MULTISPECIES: hypothetical protein [Priestia]|uniref:hypothetical protein n=1 Tax=Priestia TaxID=2800373 RepID=UPI000762ABE0|nr:MULTISPECIES: hypothetical protein [Priestia]KWU60976.1 hypothetical protein AWX17_19310 [Priestia megaterium]MCE4092749.1 hypothetical protein [Priestia megaterium]MED3821872.1 hypothetical protein [Priestia aryabhattai]
MGNKIEKRELEVKMNLNEDNSFKSRKSVDLSKLGLLKALTPIMILGVIVLIATLKNDGFFF